MERRIPDTMRAAAIDRFGGVDELEVETLPVARTFPLEQAAEAHRALEEHDLGKLAIAAERHRPLTRRASSASKELSMRRRT